MRFIFQYPAPHGPDGDMLDAGPVTELAAVAETAGFYGIAFTEHPIPSIRWLSAGGHQSFDPFIALSFAAAATTRLRLLTYLAVVPYRNPFLLAKSAATLDKLSGGRFILGAGVGYLKSEYFALGVDFERRNALFDEALDVLPRVWSGEPVTFKGETFDARDVVARPPPVQRPIPIWIGGNSRLALRRVVEKAQGWMPMGGPAQVAQTSRTPFLATLDELAEKIRFVRDEAEAHGKTLEICASYSDAGILAPEQDVERHREAFGRLAEIGVTTVILSGPVEPAPKPQEFIEAFGATYITG